MPLIGTSLTAHKFNNLVKQTNSKPSHAPFCLPAYIKLNDPSHLPWSYLGIYPAEVLSQAEDAANSSPDVQNWQYLVLVNM